MVLGVIVDRGVALLEGIRVGVLGTLGVEVVVVRMRRGILNHVVVARQDGVVQVGVIEDLHGLVSDLPLPFNICLVHDVTEVRSEVHVEGLLVLHQPFGLRSIRLATVARLSQVAGLRGGVTGVELRIRQHADAKTRAQAFCRFGSRGRDDEERTGHRGGDQGAEQAASSHRSSYLNEVVRLFHGLSLEQPTETRKDYGPEFATA